ncbi:MAG TPA: ABC transporter ATP-binding protein [Candidatus Dormibacteraeota bacterium]|nr:ABC transporter ATP-binding protein [Candidatus Dormibacteraeota bacterium]
MSSPALEARDIFRIFHSGPVETVALRGASLRVDAGEFVALVGRSGSGKSTLLQVMAGLDDPSAGTVWIAGNQLSGLDTQARTALRRRHIGVVFQRDNLWNHLTALENAALAGRLADNRDAQQRAQQLLDELGLRHRFTHLPAALSGGEQQRVGIAVALVNDPAVILADEPTGELDHASEALVLDQLDRARQARGSALLVVTHSEEIAARADRLVRMEDGVCH